MPWEIIPSGTHIDFIGKRRICAAASALILLASIVAIPVRGIRMGIDFAGGTEVQLKFAPGVDVSDGDIRSVLTGPIGIKDPSVVRYGEPGSNEYLIRFASNETAATDESEAAAAAKEGAANAEAPAAKPATPAGADVKGAPGGEGTPEAPAKATPDVSAGPPAPEAAATGEEGAGKAPEAAPTGAEAAAAAPEARAVAGSGDQSDVKGEDLIERIAKALDAKVGKVSVERVEFVGPRVGAELRDDGLKSLLFASIAILIYVAFRFNMRYAPGAIVASIHDLLITSGILVIFGVEFDLQILAAMLAILGYSLNDTIIIYDRVRENLSLHTSLDLPAVLNDSVNQTLSRTVLTSGTTLLALLSLYFLGGPVIRPFAFTMILGVFVGTYSSVYIASPVLLVLERRYGKGAAREQAKKERQARTRERDARPSAQPTLGVEAGPGPSNKGSRKGKGASRKKRKSAARS